MAPGMAAAFCLHNDFTKSRAFIVKAGWLAEQNNAINAAVSALFAFAGRRTGPYQCNRPVLKDMFVPRRHCNSSLIILRNAINFNIDFWIMCLHALVNDIDSLHTDIDTNPLPP